MQYTKQQLEEKNYSVYLNGIKQHNVVEVYLDEDRIVVDEVEYSAWGKVETHKYTTKYGRIHLVIEEVLENGCDKADTCDESDCDNCDDYCI